VAAWDGTDGVVVASVLDNGSVAGHVFVEVGPGDQQEVAVGAGGVLTIGGALGGWAGDSGGVDTISLARVGVRSWTAVWTEGGSEAVRVTSSAFRGEFELDTGAGDDSAYLEWNGAATSFRGPVWVYTGDGDDRVLVAGHPENPGQVVFTGATHWDGGAGADGLAGRLTGGGFLGPGPGGTRVEGPGVAW